MNKQRVLLTGFTGFLSAHTAIQLLNNGYQVTGTVRSASKITSIKNTISAHTDHPDQLTVEVADLGIEGHGMN